MTVKETAQLAQETYVKGEDILRGKGYLFFSSQPNIEKIILTTTTSTGGNHWERITFFNTPPTTLPDGFTIFQKPNTFANNIGQVETIEQMAQNSLTNAQSFHSWVLSLPDSPEKMR